MVAWRRVAVLMALCTAMAHGSERVLSRRDAGMPRGLVEPGADDDDLRAFLREERRRIKEERRQDRWERREERRKQRQNGRGGADGESDDDVEPGVMLGLSSHVPKSRGAPPVSASQPAMQVTPEVINMDWLRANLSSLWSVVRELTRQQSRFVGHRGHSGRGRGSNVGAVVGEGHPCPVGDDACRVGGSEVCGGHGQCSCGHCLCHPGYYGAFCQCNDHTCPLYDGMKCGGPSRGQCRCGGCVCRSGYSGNACDCPTDTQGCTQAGNGTICSGQGMCECGRCQCNDGYKGMYCEDTVYAAGVCEKLKPCVMCKAWQREHPMCTNCQITITTVDELEPTMNTCVMVNSGCLLKYSYIPQGPEAYTVLIPQDMHCPPRNVVEE